MKTSRIYKLRLPRSLQDAVEAMSKKDGTSVDQFMVLALAEKISAMNTAEFFADRRARANFKSFRRILSRKGGELPRRGDEMPPAK